MDTEKQKVKKPIYKRWYFWVGIIVILFILFAALGSCGTQDSNSTKKEETTSTEAKAEQTDEKKSYTKWSEMTLGEKRDLISNYAMEAVVPLVNSNKVDIISIRYCWDSWSSAYENWGEVSKEVKDPGAVWKTQDGQPIYNYRWNGNYKGDDGKEKILFDCWFTVDENAENKINILWLNLDGVDLIGSEAFVFPETE